MIDHKWKWEERESTRLLICESFPSHVRHVFRVCRMRLLKGSLMPSPVLWWSSRQCTVRSCILVLTYIDPQRASFRTIYWFYSRGVNFILHYVPVWAAASWQWATATCGPMWSACASRGPIFSAYLCLRSLLRTTKKFQPPVPTK